MRHPRRPLRPAAFALVALLGALACSNGNGESPAPGEPTPGEPTPGEPTPGDPAPGEPLPGDPGSGQASVTVPASTAAPGSVVTVRADGFTPNRAVEIGFGQPQSEYSVVKEARTDGAGRLETGVEVPAWASGGQSYVIVVAEGERGTKEVSEPFVVGSAGDRVRVTGEITDEGVECPALRGPFGTLYTLAVSGMEHGPGTEVMVEGTLAEMSTCMQGTTIDVESIEPR